MNSSSTFVLLVSFGLTGCVKVTSDESPQGPRAMTRTSNSASRPSAPPAPSVRPGRWASPLEKAGLPNLHRVNAGYFRGAQPSADGMRELARMNVKTVVNLRAVNSDRDEIGDATLAYEHISFKAWHAEDEDVVRFLRIVTDPGRKPVFVHCQHGADRTGMMVAAYRMIEQGWNSEDAAKETHNFGFHTVFTEIQEYLKAFNAATMAKTIENAKMPEIEVVK